MLTLETSPGQLLSGISNQSETHLPRFTIVGPYLAWYGEIPLTLKFIPTGRTIKPTQFTNSVNGTFPTHTKLTQRLDMQNNQNIVLLYMYDIF